MTHCVPQSILFLLLTVKTILERIITTKGAYVGKITLSCKKLMSEKKPFVPPQPSTAACSDDGNLLAEEAQVRYQIKPGYCIRDIAGESLVIPVGGAAMADRKMAIINPVAKFLWEKLQSRQTFGDLLLSVLQEYEVTQETAATDIREFLSELKKNNYLSEEREYVK